MHVLFFEPYAAARPHFEEALELMQVHLDHGHRVTLCHCNGNLHTCEVSSAHEADACMMCVGRRLNGVKMLSAPRGAFHSVCFEGVTEDQRRIIREWDRTFSSIDELKQFQYEHIDIGMAVASSLISRVRDPEPDMRQHAEYIDRLFKAALSVYFSFKNRLLRERYDVVYLFNGRVSNLRPLVRLCERLGIEYRVHEQGSSISKYSLSYNHLPHSPTAQHQRMLEHWNAESDGTLKERIAARYFEDRRMGIDYQEKPYTGRQNASTLPTSWSPERRNIVIFNSSDDEFAAVGREFFNPEFGRQLDVLRSLRLRYADRADIRIYLRMHPNLAGVHNRTVEATLALDGGNWCVIRPESPVSTYRLIDEASIVVTFGSTTGVEAAYWGRPSILVGNASYRNLGMTYNPETYDELFEFIETVQEPRPVHGAHVYGYYRATFGVSFKYYEPARRFHGTYRGVSVESALPGWRLIPKHVRARAFRLLMLRRPIS